MNNERRTTASKLSDPPNTKERLLEAAIDVFGKQGFSGASTRMIAGAAGVNISAIPYYFSGKEGLYQAVVEHIGTRVQSLLRNSLEEIEKHTAAKDLDAHDAIVLLEKLLTQLINFMLGSTEALRFARIVLREQLDPSTAYDTIFGCIMAPLLTNIAAMVSAVTGICDPREARLRALAVMGQVMTFRIARETMVRLLGLKGYSPEETAEIRQIVIEQTRAALTGLSREQRKE